MSEIRRIAEQLEKSFEGGAWHGPAVREALEGVTAEVAARRPIASAHTIWEIVLHMAAWKTIVTRRLGGEPSAEVPAEVDWPPVTSTSAQEWEAAVAALERAHAGLVSALDGVRESDLDVSPSPKASTRYVLLHGIIHHDLYHAGQIVLLKKP